MAAISAKYELVGQQVLGVIHHGEDHWLEQGTVVEIAGDNFDIVEGVERIAAIVELKELLGTLAVVLELELELASWPELA